MVEAARVRVQAAARRGDPIDIETSVRAYATAQNMAILTNLASRIGAWRPAIRRLLADSRSGSNNAADRGR
jgi:hypothetical protein